MCFLGTCCSFQDNAPGLWLADFNTACQLTGGWALTMTGTMDYSAPEVLEDSSPSETLGLNHLRTFSIASKNKKLEKRGAVLRPGADRPFSLI